MRLFAGTPFDQPPRCEKCGQLETDCSCPPPTPAALPPHQQQLRLSVEKRSKGKLVTVVRGLDDTGQHRAELLTELKNLCGAGGTIVAEGIEIQGDHLTRIRDRLATKGYRLKG